MAQAFIAEGVDFALSAFRPPGAWKGCWSVLDTLDPIIVVLLPPMSTALERDETRTGRAHTGRASIERAYGYDWEAWRGDERAWVLDNSSMTVDEVVAQVERLCLRA